MNKRVSKTREIACGVFFVAAVIATLLVASCSSDIRQTVAQTESLIKRLETGSEEERVQAATRIGDEKLSRAAPNLINAALDDPSAQVRTAASTALENIGAPSVAALLESARERRNRAPILEHDPAREAMIEPGFGIGEAELPERCVLCFFPEFFENLEKTGRARVVHSLGGESGENKIYIVELDGKEVTAMHPGVGASLAAARLEELIALGCRKFIACGGAGVLDSSIDVGGILIPISAVRDEGTSYHYLPPEREVAPNEAAVAVIKTVLDEAGIPYLETKTWTTDGVYRETRAKIDRRRSEGCLAVEMEASALFAVARFRGVEFGQILYAGDDVGGSEWDERDWKNQVSTREKLFWLAVEACLRME